MIRAADGQLKQIGANVVKLYPLNETLAGQVGELVVSGEKILAYLAKNPDKAPLVRRFLNYYLPTLNKLSAAYIDFSSHGTSAETMAEIEQTVPAMKEVFAKQTAKLLSDYELDISSDITVLESKLQSDGLGGFSRNG